jgi:hypothetical protein
MPDVTLAASDAAGLAQLPQFLRDWLSRDSGRLGLSMAGFVGNPAYGTAHLRSDLDRFAFLLGGDGEPLFGPGGSSPHDSLSPASRAYAGPCGPQRRSSSRWRAAGAAR